MMTNIYLEFILFKLKGFIIVEILFKLYHEVVKYLKSFMLSLNLSVLFVKKKWNFKSK